jgi:hypothetical protein
MSSQLSVAELRKLCKQKGIKGYSKLRKAELIKLCMKSKTPKKTKKQTSFSAIKEAMNKMGLKNIESGVIHNIRDMKKDRLKMPKFEAPLADSPKYLKTVKFEKELVDFANGDKSALDRLMKMNPSKHREALEWAVENVEYTNKIKGFQNLGKRMGLKTSGKKPILRVRIISKILNKPYTIVFMKGGMDQTFIRQHSDPLHYYIEENVIDALEILGNKTTNVKKNYYYKKRKSKWDN